MKFKNKWLKELLRQDESADNPLEFEEDSGWQDDGKYDWRELIFKYKDKFYTVGDSRTGSYYSDYYHESDDWDLEKEKECPEVTKVPVTIYKWVSIKNDNKIPAQKCK